MAGVWERSRESEIGGARARVLSPEDQMLHLLVHANRHGCSRLKWLVDVSESFRRGEPIDWGLLESIARKEKVTAVIYETLVHVERLLGEKFVETAVLERFSPNLFQRAAWRVLWPRKRLDEFRGRYEDGICYYFYRPLSGWNLFNFVLMGRVKDKVKYQARWIVPSLDWMSASYGQPKSLRLLKYYPIRLAGRAKNRIREQAG